MGNPVVHWEIAVRDGAKSVDFYTNLFNWEFNFDQKMNYNSVSACEGGIGGGIFQPQDENIPTYVTFYVQVDDVKKYMDKAIELGGRALMPPMDIPEIGTVGCFADPDGNTIGLFKPMPSD